MLEIAENLGRIQERMAAAAQRAGRKAEVIRLVAVSKTVPAEKIEEAIAAGVSLLGENYVQEAQMKIARLGSKAAWHFIGHLQRNKAKVAARLFDLIHSVDNPGLAAELSRNALSEKRVLPVLVQVNLSGEKTKSGALEGEVFRLLEQMSLMGGISVKGLMALPPFFEDPEETRAYFRDMTRLAERIAQQKIPGIFMEELSMGMSGDFEIAIEEGATLVRVGTAIFGPRSGR